MRAKTEKANHVVMFTATGEFYAHEVPGELTIGFFACPSCGVKVYHKKDHFFSRDYERTCTYVKEQFKRNSERNVRGQY
ncbi:hypothetical protein [Priestia aryabhattai]|uniref:hypothetical protein n=1 Tax=Priestia aryabhattai TaxID=412384 RepID=UPI001C8F1D31|nr:hypothetical protein [Priestia aryabhattai]MBY0214530.1 hypothetical protein [Priestia aryabhattai]